MPVPPVPDSRRFAKHLTGIIHSELMEVPGIISSEMRLVKHHPLTEAGPTTCAEIDVASVSGSRARIVVYPLPPDAGQAAEQMEAHEIGADVDVESLGLPEAVPARGLDHDHEAFPSSATDSLDLACLVDSGRPFEQAASPMSRNS